MRGILRFLAGLVGFMVIITTMTMVTNSLTGNSSTAERSQASIQAEPVCRLYGWVNDSATHEGISGATIVYVRFEEDIWTDQTLTDETGYYEVQVNQSALFVQCYKTGHFIVTVEINTTGESEYRQDFELEAEPTVPEMSIAIDPERNISAHNPLTVSIVVEDYNLILVEVIMGQVHNRTGDWVNFTATTVSGVILFSSTIVDGMQFEYTYEDDVFEGTAEWYAESTRSGYLVNETSSEYSQAYLRRSIMEDVSLGFRCYYFNDTLSMEEGIAYFDNDTGEYEGFEFGSLMSIYEDSPIPDAPADDPFGEIAPLTTVIPWELNTTMTFEEYIALTGSVVCKDRRSVAGLTFEYDETVPSGEYVAMVFAIDEAFNLNGTVDILTVDTDDPVAYAGEDLTLEPGDEATLTGVGSDNVGVVDYTWVIEDNDGTEVTLEGQVISYEFVEWGEYTVTLTVRDGANNEASDTMAVWVYDETAPMADAGDDIYVLIGEVFTLNGTGSSDNSGITGYLWSCEELEDWSESGAEVELALDSEGEYTFTLETMDAGGNSDTDDVVVYVTDPNEAPVADAGTDVEISAGETADLDASGSSDDAGIENYTWTFEYDGETVQLYGETVEFTFDIEGEYTVNLTVSDEQGKKGYDEVVVTVTKGDTVTGYALYAAAAIILLVVAVLAVVLMRRRKLVGSP
jgi:PKD repeat protein